MQSLAVIHGADKWLGNLKISNVWCVVITAQRHSLMLTNACDTTRKQYISRKDKSVHVLILEEAKAEVWQDEEHLEKLGRVRSCCWKR